VVVDAMKLVLDLSDPVDHLCYVLVLLVGEAHLIRSSIDWTIQGLREPARPTAIELPLPLSVSSVGTVHHVASVVDQALKLGAKFVLTLPLMSTLLVE
jgi:hypothetical protein